MELVQPIRDKKKIEEIKSVLKVNFEIFLFAIKTHKSITEPVWSAWKT